MCDVDERLRARYNLGEHLSGSSRYIKVPIINRLFIETVNVCPKCEGVLDWNIMDSQIEEQLNDQTVISDINYDELTSRNNQMAHIYGYRLFAVADMTFG